MILRPRDGGNKYSNVICGTKTYEREGAMTRAESKDSFCVVLPRGFGCLEEGCRFEPRLQPSDTFFPLPSPSLTHLQWLETWISSPQTVVLLFYREVTLSM